MQLGEGIKRKHAEQFVGKLSAELRGEEKILFVCQCNNLKPMVDRVVLTDHRLIAAGEDGKVRFAAWSEDLVEARSESLWTGDALKVVKADGTQATFKAMNRADVEVVLPFLQGWIGPPRPGSGLAIPNEGAGHSEALAVESSRSGEPVSRGEAEQKVGHRAASEAYGELVKKGEFGGYSIEIYSQGFVRVGMFLRSRSPFEKLRGIEVRHLVQDKSAGGRALASAATMGVSRLFSDEKRTVILTIATDKKVHSLQQTGGMSRTLDSEALALEVAGKAAMEAGKASAAGQAAKKTSPSTASAADRLRELAELHREGLLTDEEFAASKARILENF